VSDSAHDPGHDLRRTRHFATTHWSIVVAAGAEESSQRCHALETLCRTYWYPLYAYVRRRGATAEDARDLTQAFFARLLEKGTLRAADPERGRFRSFLLGSLNHFLANEWRRSQAKKRGGGRAAIPLDIHSGETRYALEPSHDLTPEKIFERRWALTVLERALAALRDEAIRAGKQDLFEHLKAYLVGETSAIPYREIGDAVGMTAGAVKTAAHRLRRQCRELIREEVAQTVADPEQVDDELRHLFTAISP